jgi:murein DD-endopeptidase MepM/ murein hydrolase activator NlpD
LERALSAVESDLADARDKLVSIERSLDGATAALDLKTRQLEDTLGALQQQQAILNDNVAQLYMNAPSRFGRVYSLAQDFNDVVVANQFEVSLVRQEQQAVDRIQVTRATIEVERADIASKQQDLSVQREAALEVTQRIAAIVQRQTITRAAVLHEIHVHKVLLAIVESQKAAYKRALDNLVAESNSIEAFLRGLQKGQHVVQGFGGYLKWPVSGPITSPFGWRIHPIYHYRSFHTGIDIGVPVGTRVKAARRGTVVYTGYKGAYGLVVIIDHGGALATMYAHLSRVFVRPGQYVGTLAVIAASGNTGWSTGPHLHFEVRSDGVPVNPIRWL